MSSRSHRRQPRRSPRLPAFVVTAGLALFSAFAAWSVRPTSPFVGVGLVIGLAVLGLGLATRRGTLEAGEHQAQDDDRRRLLESVVEAADVGILAGESGDRLLVANPAARRIAAIEESLGSWTRDHSVYREDGTTPYARNELPLERALRGESVGPTDLFLRTPRRVDGLWVSASARPLPSSAQGGARAVVVFYDVTTRKLAEELAA